MNDNMVWKKCFWCEEGHSLDHQKDNCPFCSGRGGEFITKERAEREVLEKQLNTYQRFIKPN